MTPYDRNTMRREIIKLLIQRGELTHEVVAEADRICNELDEREYADAMRRRQAQRPETLEHGTGD